MDWYYPNRVIGAIIEGRDGRGLGFDRRGRLARTVIVDRNGRLTAAAPDGLRVILADRHGALSDEGYRGPTLGYWNHSGERVSAAVVDGYGRLQSATIGDRSAAVTTAGQVVIAPVVERGPGLGFGCRFDRRAVSEIEVDANWRPIRYRGDDDRFRRPDAAGRWHADIGAMRGPCLGLIDGSTVATATLDPSGRLTAAATKGALGVASDYLADRDGVLARREAPLTVGTLERSGATIVVPPARLTRVGGYLYTPPTTFATTDPASAAVTGEAISIRYLEAAWLGYQFIEDGSVVVTRTSDSVVLTEGVHYMVEYDRGTITGLINTAAFNATVDYTGEKQRADIVSVDPRSGAMALTTGTATPRTPGLWEPALPAGHRALYRVLRWRDEAEMAPLYLFDERVRRDRAADIEADIARQRRRIPKLRAKIARGDPIKLGAYGSSISMMGSGTPVQVNTLPNGPRQRISYYNTYDTATRALLDTYDPGDGFGLYVREGWNWVVIKHLQSLGITVDFRNWGINGTNSTSGLNGSGYMHQGHPDRLAAVSGDGCDVIIVDAGINEIGETYSYANYLAIINSMMAGGADVIVVGAPRENRMWRDRVDRWLFTLSEVRRAAEDAGAAFVDTSRIYTELGAIGISEMEVCECGSQNHPGVKEQRAIGGLILELF